MVNTDYDSDDDMECINVTIGNDEDSDCDPEENIKCQCCKINYVHECGIDQSDCEDGESYLLCSKSCAINYCGAHLCNECEYCDCHNSILKLENILKSKKDEANEIKQRIEIYYKDPDYEGQPLDSEYELSEYYCRIKYLKKNIKKLKKIKTKTMNDFAQFNKCIEKNDYNIFNKDTNNLILEYLY